MLTQTGKAVAPDAFDYRGLFSVGQMAPRLDGSQGPYVNFDNAASTPPLKAVEAAVQAFMPWYSSVHRGNGFKSRLATHAYERARQITLGFVGADPRTHVCIFGKNTTEATNKLARRFPFRSGRDVVLVSMMEHHSNDLPYRPMAKVIHVQLLPTGELDEADFDTSWPHMPARSRWWPSLAPAMSAATSTLVTAWQKRRTPPAPKS